MRTMNVLFRPYPQHHSLAKHPYQLELKLQGVVVMGSGSVLVIQSMCCENSLSDTNSYSSDAERCWVGLCHVWPSGLQLLDDTFGGLMKPF